MKKHTSNIFLFALIAQVLVFSIGCSSNKKKSELTGWKYNDPKWGGFE